MSITRATFGMRALCAPCALLVCLGTLGQPAAARAAAADEAARPAFAAVRTLRIRAEVQQRLMAAQAAADAGDAARALAMLAAIEREYTGTRALNRYERANLHYSFAFIHEAQGQSTKAIRSYESVLAQRGLPQTMELGTRYALARLYVETGDWARASGMLDAWFRATDKPPPEALMLRAEALYRLQRFDDARRAVEAALAESRRRKLPPQESWYVLLRAVAYEEGDLALTASTLQTLARLWPRKDYLMQLSAVYGEMSDAPRQLAAMEAAWHGGWLDAESELQGLAYLYLDGGLPLRAARLLETALAAHRIDDSAANLELLGIAWRQARESARAMPWLESAAQLANDASMWARLAGIELDERRDAEAAEAARKALALGGGAQPEELRVVLGTALYRLGQLPQAREVFAAIAPKSEAALTAADWLRFLDTEIARAAELARDV